MLLRFLAVLAALFPVVASSQSAWTIGRLNAPGVSVRTITGVAYGNGRFVVAVTGVGNAGTLWSADAELWQGYTPLRVIGGGLFFIRDAFYAITNNAVYRSTDGTAWTPIHSAATNTSYLLAASDGQGLFLVTNRPDLTHVYSPDLLTWRDTAPPPYAVDRTSVGHLGHVAGRYFLSYTTITGTPPQNTIATGYAASTADGTSWTPAPELAHASGIASTRDRLVGIVGRTAVSTTDGARFTVTPVSSDVADPAKLFAAGGRFFVARNLVSSTDGIQWAHLGPIGKSISSAIWGIAYGKGKYVAGGFDVEAELFATVTAPGAPVIATAPASRAVVEGQRVELAVTVENVDTATTFQWRRNGVVLPGATNAAYLIPTASPPHAGRYTVEIRNALGTASSAPADLVVVAPSEVGRLINLSVLTTLETADDAFTVGFVVGGAGPTDSKPLLVRAGGPSLSRFAVDRPNPDPKLELFGPAGKIAENDQWSGTSALVSLGNAVGAFPFLAADSRDAAVAATVASGDTTARISSNNTTGSVIAEVYDATPAGDVTPASPRLLNVSVLKPLAPGGKISAGFVIGGRTPKTLLIRAIGPTLARFNVASPAADPSLTLMRVDVTVPLAVNDNWSGHSTLASAMANVGAFELSATSRDAALLVTLEPGNYVAQANADALGGNVLVEIYEIN